MFHFYFLFAVKFSDERSLIKRVIAQRREVIERLLKLAHPNVDWFTLMLNGLKFYKLETQWKSWNILEHFWNTMEHLWNYLEYPWNSPGTSWSHVNTPEASRKSLERFRILLKLLETSLKRPDIPLKAHVSPWDSLELLWNSLKFLGTPMKPPESFCHIPRTPLKRLKCYWISLEGP